MSRRSGSLLLAFCLLALFVVVGSAIPVPYVQLAPGSTFNTLGSVDGVELITISDTTTYPTSGHLDLTTVSESGGPVGTLTIGEALRGWRDPTVRIIPTDVMYPEVVDPNAVKDEQAAAFSGSENSAIAASMAFLKKPVTTQAQVVSVSAHGPSDGLIHADDIVMAVGGAPVKETVDIAKAVRAKPIGSAIEFTLQRDGKTVKATVTSAPRPDNPNVPYVGITSMTAYRAPFPIIFGLTDVGGPSAGLMFSMGIVDKLTPGQLNGGRFVAGTGTIDPDGHVGPIGGIEQKLVGARRAGAELFLAPRENCDGVVGNVPEGLTVTPIDTLTDAVAATEAWVAGKAVPPCTKE